jgi:hypothetical protein
MSVTREGRGNLRNQQATQPATAEARTIKRNSAGNPQVAPPGATAAQPHDSRSGLDKAVSATRRIEGGNGGTQSVESVTGPLPASSRAPRKA